MVARHLIDEEVQTMSLPFNAQLQLDHIVLGKPNEGSANCVNTTNATHSCFSSLPWLADLTIVT